MRMTDVSLGPLGCEREEGVLELRRETVSAVVRQQRLREELARVRAQAASVEKKAAVALGRGDEILARQILARGLCALEARDGLEQELASARSRVLELLAAILRAESGAWRARRGRSEAAGRGGGAC